MMRLGVDSVDGDGQDEVLYQRPLCSTLACGFLPFSPFSPHAEAYYCQHIAFVPMHIRKGIDDVFY